MVVVKHRYNNPVEHISGISIPILSQTEFHFIQQTYFFYFMAIMGKIHGNFNKLIAGCISNFLECEKNIIVVNCVAHDIIYELIML